MSVIVKSMKMPENCELCLCSTSYGCAVLSQIMTPKKMKSDKPDWCPLVEVKEPHGRLVDADKLRTDIVECMEVKDPDYEWKEAEGLKAAIEYVEKAETVIEAEGE